MAEPTTNISLTSPSISEQDNKFFINLKKNLVDENTYFKGYSAIGYRDQIIIFTGTAHLNTQLNVYINDNFNSTIISESDGSFRFGIKLVLGKNNVKMTYNVSNPTIYSDTIYIQAYNIYTWFKAYAEEFLSEEEQSLQDLQNNYLEDNRVNSLESEIKALRDNFGELMKVDRPENGTRDQFKELLSSISQAWDVPTTRKAFNLVSSAFGGQDAILTEYINNRDFPIGTTSKLRVVV